MSSLRSQCVAAVALATACTLPFDPSLLERPDGGSQADGALADAAPSDGGGRDAGGSCGVALVEGLTAETPPPAGPRPAQGELTHDPVRGACVTRVSDAESEPLDWPSSPTVRLLPDPTGTRVLVSTGETWHVYDTTTYAHVTQLRDQGRAHDVVWDARDPSRLLVTRTDGTSFTVGSIDPESGFTSPTAAVDLRALVTAAVPGATGITTNGDGTHVSADGVLWAFRARAASGPGHVITYDAEAEAIVGEHDLAAAGDPAPSFVHMGVLGEHVVMAFCGSSPRLVAFDRTFGTRFDVATSCVRADQIAMALTPDGHEAVAWVEGSSIEAMDLTTRASFRLVDGLWFADGGIIAADLSGRAASAPGWLVVSFSNCTLDRMTSACPPESSLTQDELALVEVAPSPEVYELAWHRSRARPRAVPSADLQRILFASDWEGSGAIDVYELRLPAGSLP